MSPLQGNRGIRPNVWSTCCWLSETGGTCQVPLVGLPWWGDAGEIHGVGVQTRVRRFSGHTLGFV